MTPAERAAISDLAPGSVSYPPATWDKRFARAMAEHADTNPEFEPSDKQWEHIRRLAHRYRRQAPGSHRLLCQTCTPSNQPPLLVGP